ncbi:MAG: adenine phosphoribosyltransferase [Candidatus Coatesbacteria bacterium]
MAIDFKGLIAEVPDFPKPGVSFKDLTPILSSPAAYAESVSRIADWYTGQGITAVVAAEARGFLWAGPLGQALRAAVVPVRKPKKLPRPTISSSYQLEYGTDTLHMHRDALKPGERVLIFDDVLATGGTAKAMIDLVTQLKAEVVSLAFIVELTYLHGRAKLAPHDVRALAAY